MATVPVTVQGPLDDPRDVLLVVGAHENRQPFLALSFVIALQGIFPPRP